ncbi:MAG: hypothetical protein KF729_04900 [Sandaracinaceae bacterium]|nr:hypothetical protein [Sandaracinaceae bacterium]
MSRARLALATLLLVAACDGASPGTDAGSDPVDAGPFDPASVGPTDVSILWPLGADGADLVAVSASAAGGPLLPASVLGAIPPLDREAPNDPATIRVVSMRLDPCFPGRDLSGPVPCRAQVRLVAQPIRDVGGSVGAADAAVHLHFEPGEAAWRRILTRIVAASRAAGVDRDAPLGVHPALAAGGASGSFGRALQEILLTELGPAALTRVTFVTRELPRAPQWRFGGVEVVAGAPSTLPLVGLATPSDTLTLDMSVVGGGLYTTSPALDGVDDATLLFDLESAASAGADAQRAAWVAALRIESPDRHSPETADCASCHVAQHLARDAERDFGLGPDHPDRYDAAGVALALALPDVRERIRAFGYFEREPQILQRTVNETAEVVRRIRATP